VIVIAGAALAIGAAGACGDSGLDGPAECVGGVFVEQPDGTQVCEGKCSPDLCVENNVCVGNRCRLSCDSHNDCNRDGAELQGCVPQEGDSEDGLNDGDTVYVCTDLDKSPAFLKPCPLVAECDADFACPDGTPCAAGVGSDLCSATECRAMHCSSASEGDATAYCTTFDCTVDAECGPGMYCGRVELPNIICGTDKGTEEPCVDPASFALDKATYQEGPFSLFRNACKKREPCAPCADAADCSLSEDLACVNLNDESICAKTCDSGDDCPNDYGCQSNFCIPKTNTCITPPPPNFCFPCFTDLDCGPSDGTISCIETTAGQRACFDLSFPVSCTSDADCPTAPSGLSGECLDEPDGYDSSSSVYQRCFVPYASGKFQCWKD
jgi:hypothetical protein